MDDPAPKWERQGVSESVAAGGLYIDAVASGRQTSSPAGLVNCNPLYTLTRGPTFRDHFSPACGPDWVTSPPHPAAGLS